MKNLTGLTFLKRLWVNDMKKYVVRVIKWETCEVEAENEDDAIALASEMCDSDEYAFQGPADEFEVEEMPCTE